MKISDQNSSEYVKLTDTTCLIVIESQAPLSAFNF